MKNKKVITDLYEINNKFKGIKKYLYKLVTWFMQPILIYYKNNSDSSGNMDFYEEEKIEYFMTCIHEVEKL